MQVLHTAGEPPRRGSTILAIIGSTMNIRPALRNSVVANAGRAMAGVAIRAGAGWHSAMSPPIVHKYPKEARCAAVGVVPRGEISERRTVAATFPGPGRRGLSAIGQGARGQAGFRPVVRAGGIGAGQLLAARPAWRAIVGQARQGQPCPLPAIGGSCTRAIPSPRGRRPTPISSSPAGFPACTRRRHDRRGARTSVPIAGAIAAVRRRARRWCRWPGRRQSRRAGQRRSVRTHRALIWSRLSSALDAGPLDGVYLDLHGAAVADSFPDIEGELLRRVRAIAATCRWRSASIRTAT